MIKPSHLAPWLRCCCAGLVLACAAIGAASVLHAQTAGPAASNNPAVATNGATLIHGNYCGAGNRPGKPPIDALDLACMNHDACTPTGGIPTCDCNERLRDEAAAVARDPRQAPELQSLAALTAAAATAMICKPVINAVAPPAPAVEPAVAPAPVDQPPAARAPMQIVPSSVAPAPSQAVSVETAPAAEPPTRSLP